MREAVGGAALGPVSYTHLDVYKRQSQILGHSNISVTETYLRVDIEHMRLCSLSLEAVSYTHLPAGRLHRNSAIFEYKAVLRPVV